MKNILILAAAGMAGHVISNILEQTNQYNILKTVRESNNIHCHNLTEQIYLDLKNQDQLKNTIIKFNPDIIINSAGVLVQNSKDNPAEAIYINSYLPHYLNQLSTTNNFKLIHISTDCVFNGYKGQYTENDPPDATDIYGKTKALGEINTHNNHLTIRTSIIGPELKTNGTGLMHWLFNQSGDIKGFTNAIWSGVTTLELAKFIKYAVENTENSHNICGLYHLTNNNAINKFDLITLIKAILNIEYINIIPDSNYKSNKSFINTYTNLYNVPSYKDMLLEIKNFILKNKELYPHYKFIAHEDTIFN